MTNQRLNWLDTARGLCMLMVLWFHAEMYSGMGQKFSICITPFFMQAFFFLSGYLFIADPANFSFVKKCKNALRRLWLPYLYFTLLMMFPKMWLHHWSICKGLEDILTGHASWFVYVLGIVQIVIGMGYALSRKNDKVLWGMATFGIFAGWSVVWTGLPSWLELLGQVFRMMPFFVLGILCQHHKRNDRSWKPFLLIFVTYLACFSIDQLIFTSPRNGMFYGVKTYLGYMLCGLTGTLMLYTGIQHWDGWRWLRFLGRNSLGFYFLNGMFYTAIMLVFGRMALPKALLVSLMMALAVIVLSVATILIHRFVPWMIGERASAAVPQARACDIGQK